jgi:hypothetical protein
MVLPEDVQAVAESVIAHRVRPAPDGGPARAAVAALVKATPVP